MATSLQLSVLLIAILLHSLYFSGANAQAGAPLAGDAFSPNPAVPYLSYEVQNSFSPTTLFEPILTNLGFQELAMAVPSLSDTAFTAWNGPSTLFAPTDASIRSCVSCSIARLLREHIVPGLFSHDYLRKLAFGTKIETMDPGRCITVTSSTDANNNTRIYIGGVEIIRPDLFNNGLVVVHGLEGFVAPLSPFSCNVERMTSLSFPLQPDRVHQPMVPSYMMRLMLRDAMLRLRNSGFSILALAMKVKYAELVNLQNMTVFALDDISIFTGSQAYVSNVRFHIVPNKLLPVADLDKLPEGTALPSLEKGQSLVVTTAGGVAPIRINYVRIKIPDVMRNLKIVVHSVYLPFPHLQHAAAAASYDDIIGGDGALLFDQASGNNATGMESCAAVDQAGGCVGAAPSPPVKPMVEMEENHGL